MTRHQQRSRNVPGLPFHPIGSWGADNCLPLAAGQYLRAFRAIRLRRPSEEVEALVLCLKECVVKMHVSEFVRERRTQPDLTAFVAGQASVNSDPWSPTGEEVGHALNIIALAGKVCV